MARARHGLSGVYNSTALTLSNEEGAALGLDVSGHAIVTVGAGATDLGKAEDSAHVSADTGVMALAVRNDANAALSGTDLDYTPISVDSAGNPQVDILTVTTGTAAGNLGKAEDAAHVSADVGVAILGKRTDTAASSAGTDGDYATVNQDSLGHAWVREGFAPDYEDNTNDVAAVIMRPLAVSTYAWTLFSNFGANTTLNVKVSAGNIKSIYCHNRNAAIRYIQIHNTATVPTSPTGIPLYTFLIPGSGTAIIDGAFLGENGANLTTGIAFAISVSPHVYDSTGVTASEHTTIIHFK